MKRVFSLLLFCCFSTVLPAQEGSDCYESFFSKAAKVKNAAVIRLVVNQKEQSLAGYLKNNVTGLERHLGLRDLDGDGKAELIIYNFTGGAHCCDEWYFFKNLGPNKYEPAGKLFAGNTCISGTSFLYDFAEIFGYFYTCYACELEEKKKKGDPYERIANISLKYKDGKLQIEPGDAALKDKLLRNLRYIKSLGWDGGVKEGEFDDGRRKALVQALAVYYFAFGKNLPDTKTVFAAHYPFKDAAAVWKEFSTLLMNVQRQNSF